MIEDLNSIFEDPDKEEKVILPNSEIAQEEIEVGEEPVFESEETSNEEEEVDVNQLFNQVYESEFNSEEFQEYVKGVGQISITSDLSGGKSTLAEMKTNRMFDRVEGLFRVDEFKNAEARSAAIAFNTRIEEQKNKYQEALAPLTKVAMPGVSTDFENDNSNYVYKYEITPEGELQYFFKKNEDDKDWILQEDKASKWAIQTYFGQNESTVSDVNDYYKKYNQYKKYKEFNNEIFDVDSANKYAIQAIEDGLINAADIEDYQGESDKLLDKYKLYDLVGTENAIYTPQSYSIKSSDYEYTGELTGRQLQEIGYDPEDSLKIFNQIFKNEALPPGIKPSTLGLNLNAFLGYVNDGNIPQGNRDLTLDFLIDKYYEAQQSSEEDSKAKNLNYLIQAIDYYRKEEIDVNKVHLLSTYFKNQLNPKSPRYKEYVEMIEAINLGLEAGLNVTSGDIEKLDLLNWTNSRQLLVKVKQDMVVDGGFENEDELDYYLDNFTLFKGTSWNDYVENAFPEYAEFWRKAKNKLKTDYENRDKGNVLYDTFVGGFGGGIYKRAESWLQGASNAISGASAWLNWDAGAEFFDADRAIFDSMVDEEMEGFYNLRSGGFVSGKTATVDGIEYILTADGTIYNRDDEIRYVPGEDDEGLKEANKIIEALKNSNTTDSGFFLGDSTVAMGQVGGYLLMDIGGTILLGKGSNRIGLTSKYKNLLGNKRFKLNPKSVNLISQTTNTAAYYTMSGAADGYMRTYKLVLGEYGDADLAHELATGVAWRQGAWYGATSIFVPQSMYNKIPWRIGNFKNTTKKALEAYKNGGKTGFNNFWRNTFTNLSPTSRGVVNKIYNFSSAGFGETLQEIGQETGSKLWINDYINDTVGKKLASTDFTYDEVINTSVYSFVAGGVAGQLGAGAKINTNTEQYIQSLLYLGKDQSKLEQLLNRMVGAGDLNAGVAKEFIGDVRAVNNQAYKMPTWIKSQNVLEAAQIMEQIDSLNRQKKEMGNNFKGFDSQIKDLQIDLNLLYASDLDVGNQKIADQIGYEYFEGSTTEVENKIAELKAQDPNANVDNSIGFGAFVEANGKQYALIDTMKSAKKNFFTTGQHEGFHGLLAAIVRRDPSAGGRLGQALLKEIRKGLTSGKIKLNNNEFGIRFQQYINDKKIGDNIVLEEVMPLLSEALTRGGVTIESSVGSKIGDAFRRFLSSFGINTGFSSGADVLNLVRDYNSAVESGRGLSRGLRNLAQDKGSFGLGQTNIALEQVNADTLNRGETDQSIERASKDLETLVNDFKAGDQDVDVESLTTQYQKLGKDALKRWAAQRGVTINLGNPQVNEEVTSLLNKEFNSFIRNFDPAKSSVSTYMNNIAKRIGPVLVEEGARKTKQVSQDVLTEKGISPETTTQPDIDTKAKPTGRRTKVFPQSVKVIADNITGEIRSEQIAFLKNDITEAILRVGTDPKKVAKYIVEKTKTKEYRALIKKALGPFGSQQYIDNVNKLFNNNTFIKSIPVANIKRRFGKLFGIKQTGTTPTIKIENGKRTDFRKQVYQIPAINDAKLRKVKQYFLAGEKRHQSLMSLIGEGLAVEAINEIAADQEFMNNLQNRLEFRDSDLTAEQFMAELEFDLDKRNLEDTSLDDVRLSKEIEGEFVAPELTQKRISQIGAIAGNSLRKELKKVGLTLYPTDKTKLTDAQKKGRQESVVKSILKFGTAFFTGETGKGKTGRNKIFYLGNFFEYKGIFKKDKGKGIDQMQEMLDAPLDPEFVESNPEVKKIATKNPKTQQWFLDKKKLENYKYGSNFSKADVDVLKQAETEQDEYAKLSTNERKAKLQNSDFIDLQNKKIEVLEKIVKNINEDVRDGDGNIIPERFEFWASWLDSQVNLPRHPIRALAPIKFMSLSKLPVRTSQYNLKNKLELNYVAEHTLPANNVASAIADMIYNNTVDSDFKIIKDNYIQGQLLRTADTRLSNKTLGEGDFKSVMPRDFWNMNNPNVWVRYLLGDPNINLNEYVVYENGKIITIAESLGLPLAKADQNPDSINAQRNLLKRVLAGDISIEKARAELKSSDKVDKKSSKQVIINQKTLFPLINADGDTESSIEAMNNADTTAAQARRYSKETKGISVFDFDDTLAFSDSKVLVKMPDGKINKITPAEFAIYAEQLQQDGAEFDFSEFNKVVNGRKGPLADLALKRQKKFGSGDIFVLTARPQLSAESIKLFLDGIGLNIPIENITGLADGSPDAKALWVLDKTAKGYNDFYFADDSLPNVQAVKNILDQVDVKSDVQQAKASKEVDLDKEFNVIIEQQSGKEWFKEYSDARAKVEGKKANRFEFFIPPSAEDFVGLMYRILPKGKNGDRAFVWIKENLIDLFNKAEQEVIAAKIAASNDFKALRDSLDNIPSNLQDQIGYSNYTYSQALRVFIWDMQGMEIPGLSTRDKNKLVSLIKNDTDMKVFAEKIAFIQKGRGYPPPKDSDWVGGSITGDIINSIQKTYRKEALADWQQNVDIIFSKKNLNKLEALYGSNYVVALKNILARMKSGSNRAQSNNPQVDNVIDWINNSVGTTMFLNRKSALLQLISNVNFINWSDNNLVMAGKAFANQKQYWSDVMYLMNSDYLVQRRNGMKINVAESEIAEASKRGGLKGVISYLLNKGFVFTRIADSIAIATGGATFYRNRLNKLLKTVNPDTGKLYTKKEAETKAFDDFYQISEETQQSSRTDRISMQQASGLGRIVLNYANTPMQYARIIKRSTQDLLAGRGDWKSNVSKIVYYGAVQNLIFNALQQALFALAFGDEEEQKKAQSGEDRAANIGFGMLSSLLRGLGYGGALVDTLISMSREISKGDDGLPQFGEDFAWNIFDFSPTIDTKVRKIRAIRKTFIYNRDQIKRRGFNIENPAYYSLAQVIDAGFNIPLDRAMRMVMTLMQISDRDTAMWQRFALAFGWSSWSVGLPYWGTPTTVGNEAQEDANRKKDYEETTKKLKGKGYKRIPMTGPKSGKPAGKLNEDYIEVVRPNDRVEYWIIPKMKIK